MTSIPSRLHALWETHELHMEVAVIALSAVLLSLLVLVPATSEAPTKLEVPTQLSQPQVETLPHPLSSGYFVSSPDTSLERAQIEQDITKTNREISNIQETSLRVTALIQKECGGQTNDCAKKLQASFEDTAREYDKAQERLKALTAALGNVR